MTKKPEAKKATTKTSAASKATKPAPMPDAKRPVRAKAAKATREPVTPQAATPAPVAGETQSGTSMTSRMTCLDAAHAVLTRLGKPMRIREIMEQMIDRQLWVSPGGATPDATLTSAIIRDIARRGEASRFKRVDRGYYAAMSQ